MNKVTGIDVSKATFDLAFYHDETWSHYNLPNNKVGFNKLLRLIDKKSICVMEASGPYYLKLAMFLNSHQVQVSVVNPLVIRRFSQMRLIRAKTDKKDARVIAEYGMQNKLRIWTQSDRVIIYMQQLISALEGFNKQITMLRNQLEAFKSTGMIDSQVRKSLQKALNSLLKQKEVLEDKLAYYASDHYADSMDLLTSIPGIGPKTASMLIVVTNNFKKFDNYKALIAYVGFSPRVFESGTSIKGKGHICKLGKSQIRKLLYMCSWTAKKANSACKAMYERMKQKGKPERVIKIAIANKLLKQAFAIVTSQKKYEENYMSKPCF